MKAFCAECGRPVPESGGRFGRCAEHPEAKRVTGSWVARQFAAMRSAVDAVKHSPGLVFRGGTSYWSVMDSRARGSR